MKLSYTVHYAVRAVAYIAAQSNNHVVIGHRAARKLSIPKGFLLRILVSLSRANILLSVRGPNGGYRLARPAREITLLDIIEAVEGPMRGSVLYTNGDSVATLDRRLERVFDQSNEILRKHFHRIRVAELVEGGRK